MIELLERFDFEEEGCDAEVVRVFEELKTLEVEREPVSCFVPNEVETNVAEVLE